MSRAGKSSSRQILGSAGLLGIIAVLGTGLLAGVHELTRDRIAEQERLVLLRQLSEVLPPRGYDNDLLADAVDIRDPEHFHHAGAVRVYRARNATTPFALVLDHVAPDGYNGDIRLLTAVLADGRLSGVRVVSHRETPGLGDPIEAERSDWILGFSGRSLQDPDLQGWAVRRDGGEFDQFTGATITPRAVVGAVKRALEYAQEHGAELYGREAELNDDG